MHETYQLLDFGDGARLEQWGPYRLARPDPTAMRPRASADSWQSADAVYQGEKGKGEWIKRTDMPDAWVTAFGDINMCTRLAPYKHTGVFPEQRENWQWARSEAHKKQRPLTVLNLFAYTGGATMALSKDGHFVTHVDASKPAIAWAKENQTLNDIPSDRIRWILEDAPLFVSREIKRGKTYDAILLDPPAYGHSPTGKTWRVERDLAPLLEQCAQLLSDDPAFLILNGYAQNDTPESFHRLLMGVLRTHTSIRDIFIDAAELLLHSADRAMLSTGIVARVRFARE